MIEHKWKTNYCLGPLLGEVTSGHDNCIMFEIYNGILCIQCLVALNMISALGLTDGHRLPTRHCPRKHELMDVTQQKCSFGRSRLV